jgi:hypothetical protein
VLTRQKDGIVFERLSPKIANPDQSFVAKERVWILYKSCRGPTAVCAAYFGFYNADRRHDWWNDQIYSVLGKEIFKLKGDGYRVSIQADFNCWVGDKLADGGIPGNDPRTNPYGAKFIDFLKINGLVHINAACRIPGDWSTRIANGLWTRHAPGDGPSTVLDFSVVSAEHLSSVDSLDIDQNGSLGGSSDHNIMITRLADRFVQAVRRVNVTPRPAWNIKEYQDWSGFRDVVESEVLAVGLSVVSLSHLVLASLFRPLIVLSSRLSLASRLSLPKL